MAWAIRSKDDLILLISPSIESTLMERLGGSSSSPVIVRKFIEALIPIDAGNRKDERCRLDLILAITNPGDFQVGTVIESINTTLESTSYLLKSRSKR